jgi:hypothetical protein
MVLSKSIIFSHATVGEKEKVKENESSKRDMKD